MFTTKNLRRLYLFNAAMVVVSALFAVASFLVGLPEAAWCFVGGLGCFAVGVASSSMIMTIKEDERNEVERQARVEALRPNYRRIRYEKPE